MGYDCKTQLISLIRAKSKEAIAVIGPQKSIQLLNSKTLPYLMTHETGQQTERNETKIDQEIPTRDTEGPARGRPHHPKELPQYMSSWRMLKDRLLSPNSCNPSCCPLFKERLELHHYENHRKDPKSSPVGTSRTKEFVCNFNPKKFNPLVNEMKLSDKITQNLSAYNLNTDNYISIQNRNRNKDATTSISKDNMAIKNENINYVDASTAPHSFDLIIKDDDIYNTNTIDQSKKLVNNSTKLKAITLAEHNSDKDSDRCCDCPDKNECIDDNPPPRFVECCNSSCDFNLMNENRKKDASVFCDVPVSEKYTTTYRDSYAGDTEELQRSLFARKIMLDKPTDNSKIPGNESDLMVDVDNPQLIGNKVMIDCCNSVQSGMIITGNMNTDINQPSASKNINGNTYNINSDDQRSIPCGMQIIKPYETHDIFGPGSSEKTRYTTTYRDAFTVDVKPLDPAKKDSYVICKQRKTSITKDTNVDKKQCKIKRICTDGPCKSDIATEKTSNTNIMLTNNSTAQTKCTNCCCGNPEKVQNSIPVRKFEKCYCDSPEKSHPAHEYTTAYSLTYIENLDKALLPRKTNIIQTDPFYSRNVDEKMMIDNSKSVQCVVNVAENTKMDNNMSSTSKSYDDNSIKELSDDYDCCGLYKPEYRESSTTTFSDKLINTIKSLILCMSGDDDVDQNGGKPRTNIAENPKPLCKPCFSKNCNYSQTNKNNGPCMDTIRTCECPVTLPSSKNITFLEKTTSYFDTLSFAKRLDKNKQVLYCKSPTDSSLITPKTPSDSDNIHDSISDIKMLQKNSPTTSKQNKPESKCPILKEVNEWILEVPAKLLERDAKKYNNEALNGLFKQLKKLSNKSDNLEYDENVRHEIDACLSKIIICYPGDKSEMERFKQSLVQHLSQRLKQLNKKNIGTSCSATELRTSVTSCLNFDSQIQSKDVEIRICITEWLRSLTKNSSMTENQISQLTDFVVIRINPLLDIPVSKYNHKIILKTAIVNIINDLSIGNINRYQDKDLQIHNYAKDLAEKLLNIQGKYVNTYNNSSLTTNKYSELRNCIYHRETVINSEIRKCFKNARIELKDVVKEKSLIDEVGVILMDCYEIPHPEAERDAKKEIVNILVNATNVTRSEASHLAKNVMREVRRLLKKGEVKEVEKIKIQDQERSTFNFSSQIRQPCTVLVCTSMMRQSNLPYKFQ